MDTRVQLKSESQKKEQKMHLFHSLVILLNLFLYLNATKKTLEEEEHGVIYANNCEACKVLALELQDRLSETGKSHDILELG